MNLNLAPNRLDSYALPVSGWGHVASVCVLRDVTFAAAIKGVFPGTSAWSPPN